MDQSELQEILWDDNGDFKEIYVEMVDSDRWHIYYEKVVEQVSTGNFYELQYGRGATEYQEWEGDISFVQVYPKEVTTTIYTTDKPE